MRRPDFFVVGAPKCGTTAMDHYLKQHPEIFVLERKEAQFFGTDLYSPTFIRDEEEYLGLYSGARDERRVGETSVWGLYSERAAAEIKRFNSDASIIAMLRNPVEMIPSLHRQYLYTGNEDIEDLKSALAAEEDRKKGWRIPSTATFAQGLFYRETARYARQVRRYFDAFGREKVHIVIFDDLKQDSAETYESTLRFLGVATDFRPDFRVVNPSKRVRSQALRNLSKHPREGTRRFARAIVPRPLRQRLVLALERYNTRYETPQPVNPELLESLRAEFVSEVEALSGLLGRDLTRWVEPQGPAPRPTGVI